MPTPSISVTARRHEPEMTKPREDKAKMKARDLLTILGTILFLLGDDMKTNGKTELEWRIGRWSGLVGVALLGSRAVPQLNRKP